MTDLYSAGLLILGAILALLCGGGAVYLRGRAAGKSSVPPQEQVRAEEHEAVVEEKRVERTKVLEADIQQIREDTRRAVESGKATRAEAELLLEEARRWREDA